MFKLLINLCLLLLFSTVHAASLNCTNQITDKTLPRKCGFGDIILATMDGAANFCDFTVQIIPVAKNGQHYYMCIVAQPRQGVSQSKF